MFALTKGEFLLNNITVLYTDNLTSFLQKTKKLSKNIENINNYQHIKVNDVYFFFMHCNIRFVFSPSGDFLNIQIYLLDEEKNTSNIDEYKKALKKLNNGKTKYYWGNIGICIDPWFNCPSICILIKTVPNPKCIKK